MGIKKINSFIDAYSKAIDLPENYKKILMELMPKIIEKYSHIVSSISVKEDNYNKYVIKPVNGKYSVEDFFLNRLMRNVWWIDNESIAKGTYSTQDMCVGIDESRLNVQLEGKISKTRSDYNELNEIARKKVIMHEFEHALQTQFSGKNLDYRYKNIYKRIFKEVSKINNGKYADSIQTYESINKPGYEVETCIHCGLHYSSSIQEKKTYSELNGEINMCEIFNETESLEMAGAKPQTRYIYPNGVYYVIKNKESSNYPITNYGNILKTLLGDKLTFTGMYLNPEKLFKTFNSKYNDVFHKAYDSDNDAWQILIEQLKMIKDYKNNERLNYSLNQRLQETLAKCLEKDVNSELQKDNPNLELLRKKIMQFRAEALNADNKEIRNKKIKHFPILKSLKQKVESAQEIGQTQFQAETEERNQKLSFSAIKRATKQAKITQQEINDETIQIKELIHLGILNKKQSSQIPGKTENYNYLKER